LDRDDLSGIVKIYNTFYHQGHFCIVMELLDISLEKLTQKRVKFSLSDIREVGHQILSTVDFLHKNNYIHADLKPENILLAYGHIHLFSLLSFYLFVVTNFTVVIS
jgi:serine/threonine protein kinase